MIIYPPYIADTVPAFVNGKIKIPFFINPATTMNQIKGAKIAIKPYNATSQEVYYSISNNIAYNNDGKSGIAIFDNEGEFTLVKNSYYKFQLSFHDGDEIFESFSTAAVGKCLGDKNDAPQAKLKGRQNRTLSVDSINMGSSSFTSLVSTPINEPIYNYRFMFKNMETNEIVEDTDWLLHNVEKDEFNESKLIRGASHTFSLEKEIEPWTKYSINYQFKTINGYEDSITCLIVRQEELPIAFKGKLNVYQDNVAKENGYVIVSLDGTPIKGSFELQRTSDGNKWSTLSTFNLTKLSHLNNYVWKDWSVEQGIKYIYAIRQTARGQYSERLSSQPILVEFDHMFLSDGERQLKIAYNPKVSSIKDTILESKMDTIGSKYPFFFRNEKVRYKELPISGLISYLSDDNELFLTKEELDLDILSTNLDASNFGAERRFKMAVMNWLNNGEPKLFRSPGEGNFVVRTMNTSLSPNDQVGRMLHTFTSTAYEIMDNTLTNLQKYGLVHFPGIEENTSNLKVITFTFDQLHYEDGIATIVKNNMLPTGEKIIANSISDICWVSVAPNMDDYIELTPVLQRGTSEAIKYYNNSLGQFNIGAGFYYSAIAIKEPTHFENYGSSITFSYVPDLTEDIGTDEFEYMIATSSDTLFSVPAGQKLYETVDSTPGALLKQQEDAVEEEYDTIYRTYGIIVRKDTTQTQYDDYNFVFKNQDGEIISTIDCSDGQIRYFMNVDDNIKYEKGAGLIVDIYACIGGMREFNSSLLGSFLLGYSMLGGN